MQDAARIGRSRPRAQMLSRCYRWPDISLPSAGPPADPWRTKSMIWHFHSRPEVTDRTFATQALQEASTSCRHPKNGSWRCFIGPKPRVARGGLRLASLSSLCSRTLSATPPEVPTAPSSGKSLAWVPADPLPRFLRWQAAGRTNVQLGGLPVEYKAGTVRLPISLPR